ncbi:MAG: DUF2804 domain-containing protein [Treponema sp.]|nr:DUF2804 domain-containing protein [Treponema sp.]
MYTREILPPTASPIIDGKPVTGTWNKAFDKVDLLEIKKPFRNVFSKSFINYRIKEWQSFSMNNESFLLETLFFNVKHHRAVQVMYFDKENKKKHIFRRVAPSTGWRFPNNLSDSFIESHLSNLFIRVHNRLDSDIVTLGVNIEATRKQPSLTFHLTYNLNNADVTPIVVSLGFSDQRIMYAYKALAPVWGDFILDGNHIKLKQENCSGIFCDYKGLFPYQMHGTMGSAMGFDDGRRFGFHIAENQAKEINKNNENALWINGKLTPLPPVLVTMPYGVESTWVIQDVEGMVDLTFTPLEQNRYVNNLFFSKIDYHFPIGVYNGVLTSSSEEKIIIKNLIGVGKKLFLRV